MNRTRASLLLLAIAPILGVACSSAPAENDARSHQAVAVGKPPPPPHGGVHVAAPAYPTLNQVFQKAIHNSYWVDVDHSPDDPYAAGSQMRIWDMMLHEHARSLEWDLHDYMNAYVPAAGRHPGEYRVYHTNEPDNSTCSTLADCLQLLQRLDYVLPQHEIVHIALELKEVDKLLQDEGLFDDSGFKPEDLDRVLWEHLGSKIYTPAEFLSRCDATMNMRQCATAKGWPTIDELRGRYVFTVHGTETGGAPGACNERAWWQYASSDIHTRAAFPMYVVSDNISDFNRPVERQARYKVADDSFATMWRTALDNTVFFDVEDLANPDFVPPPPDAGLPLDQQIHAMVRPAAAHLIDGTVPPNSIEDNLGATIQRADVASGWQLLMTDYPANYISDVQQDDPSPLKLATRVSRPFSVVADTTATRPLDANAGPPTWSEPQLVEPGSRIYFDTANRVTTFDLLEASAGSTGFNRQTDPLHLGYAQALMLAPAASVEATQDWEVFPATSMSGHNQGPMELTPFGAGCFVAAANASGAPASPLAANTGDYLKVCRVVQADDARDVNVTVTTMKGGVVDSSQSQTLDAHVTQGASLGDALRVVLSRTGTSTVASIFTASEMNADGTPRWIAWSSGTLGFASDLRYQGLAAQNDGVFTGTRKNGQPVSLSQLSGATNGNYVYDLSYCTNGTCASALPSHETFYTSLTNAQFVGVHETEGAVYGNQWRTLYTTDQYEVTSSGLGQLPRMDKFVLMRTAPTDSSWTPLYKCIDWTQDVHTYWMDTDPSCPNDAGPAGHSAGAMGFIAATQLPETAPLMHLRKGTQNATNVNTHDHYFALGYDESNAKQTGEGYSFVKIVGYVYTPSSLVTPPCVPKTACIATAKCGTQDDGCGGTLTCGTCSGGTYCNLNSCIAPGTNCRADCNHEFPCQDYVGDHPTFVACEASLNTCLTACSCVKKTCASQSLTCGPSTDGCGGALDCGTCAAGSACESGACACQPTACNGRCGTVSNGCGGVIACGKCGPCTPSCSGKRCGVGDGCGGSCYGSCAKAGYLCTDDGDGVKICERGE